MSELDRREEAEDRKEAYDRVKRLWERRFKLNLQLAEEKESIESKTRRIIQEVTMPVHFHEKTVTTKHVESKHGYREEAGHALREWYSDESDSECDAISPQLRQLRTKIARLLNAHRFEEAAVLQAKANKLEQQEVEENRMHLGSDFDTYSSDIEEDVQKPQRFNTGSHKCVAQSKIAVFETEPDPSRKGKAPPASELQAQSSKALKDQCNVMQLPPLDGRNRKKTRLKLIEYVA
jgi:hypothetical protein